MKKTVVIIASVLLLLGVVSCFDSDDPADTESQESGTSSIVILPDAESSRATVSNVQSSKSETSSKQDSNTATSSKQSSEYTESKNDTKPASSVDATSSETDNSQTVYRTPSGKRYHFDADCGGKNSTATTLNKAKNAGLTPCQKCAQ